nr:paraneoplastic antigen Ma1 homolog [Nothobranchius furzeri]
MSQLLNWCKGEGINPSHAVLLKGVPEDTEVSVIWGTVQLLDVLEEAAKTEAIPADVMPEGSDSPWRIISPVEVEKESLQHGEAPSQTPDPDTSQNSFFQSSSPEAIIRAVGDILQLTSKPTSDSSSYRRLRTFSGVLPTPLGEEPLDNWLEQARLMIEESDKPDKEKKMRIMESVKGPAMEILQAVRFNNPDTTPTEYLDVIENTFGTTETGEELYFAFRMMCQHPTEKLSEFLRRMERILNKVVQKGGLPLASKDKARIDQLIKGAIRSDMMILSLRLRERKIAPPTFLQLLNEIRVEEEHEASRRRLNPPKSVHVKRTAAATEIEATDLGVEVERLRSQVIELQALAQSQRASPSAPPPAIQAETVNSEEDGSLQAFKREVVKLRKQVSAMSVKSTAAPQELLPLKDTSPTPGAPRASMPRDPKDIFCYRCGEVGHISTKCTSPENYPKVIQKLIQAQRRGRAGPGCTDGKIVNANVKRSAVKLHADNLPKGLVGPPSTAHVKVEGKPCTALLDSGSQVTIVFDSWYTEHLSHVPLNPVSGLAIWGLSESESSYPYKGYIEGVLRGDTK